MSDAGGRGEPAGYYHKWLKFRIATDISCKPDCEECPMWGGLEYYGLCEIAGIGVEFKDPGDGEHIQPDWCPRLRPAEWPPCDGCSGCRKEGE